MGKLHFEWKEGQLLISQCDKIKTDPNQCNGCKYRFQCFTERPKPSSARLNTAQIPELSRLLKEIEIAFDVDDKP